ncbi:MAG: LysM peptidoglycan-binding domain-containing protein [Chlamydiota bacterium]
MKYISTCFFLCTLCLVGCSSQLAVLHQDKHEHSLAVRELREEIADIKHGLNNTQVELQILEDQYKTQDREPKKTTSSSNVQDPRVAALEKKLTQISTHANQTAQSLNDCHVKIAELEKSLQHQNAMLTEIVQLKSSLTSLTSSLQKNPVEDSLYKVKPGDSLEKIARLYKVSITSLKEENNLSNNKIMIGQELKFPSGASR